MHKREGYLLILSGPAGAGKTTLSHSLCAADRDCILSISATTRKPRGQERDGVDYFFLTREEFLKRGAANGLAEHAEFSGNFYGTPKDFLDRNMAQGKTVVLDIEVNGAAQLRAAYPKKSVFVFLLPPSPEALVERLAGRGTEDKAEINRRLGIARNEIASMEGYDYFIINDNIERASADLLGIVRAERNRIRGGEREAWLGGRNAADALRLK